MKLLLHTCCAPCLIHPLQRLKGCGFQVSGFFYNPNIHPLTEYKKRRETLEVFGAGNALEVFYPQYSPAEFFQAVHPVRDNTPQTPDGCLRQPVSNGVNLTEEKLERCPVCWFLRLNRTAEFAKSEGFDAFSSTLLVSPYQDQLALKRIGFDISKEKGIEFFYEDFRPGFKRAHNFAKENKIYCQNYCGCVYSQLEKYKK